MQYKFQSLTETMYHNSETLEISDVQIEQKPSTRKDIGISWLDDLLASDSLMQVKV